MTKKTPLSFQYARQFRKECEDRKVDPNNAAYDATGGEGPLETCLKPNGLIGCLP